MTDKNKQKLKTLKTIEVELSRRLDTMRKSNINLKINLINNDTKALGTIADVYDKAISENLRMLRTMDKILSELMNGE